MTWSNFIWFALPAIALWVGSGALVYFKKFERLSNILMVLGIATFSLFVVLFWVELERPPLRTMGETRLWYSLFLSTVGFIAYRRWRYPWILTFAGVVASIFVIINLAKPDIHSKSLMPALQSSWFIPHVTSYIISYAMLGAATIGAIVQLRQTKQGYDKNIFSFMDNMVYIGFGLLMMGMLMGCIWAKDAWGHYWSWDPKETWAFITSAGYLGYIHLRLRPTNRNNTIALWLLIIDFVLLMITWLGVSYLPSAQSSIHVY